MERRFSVTEVYSKDGIIIHNGDNVDVMRDSIADASIDLVVTSPPYDNLRTYGGHTWDFEGVAQQLWRAIKPGGVVVWVVADATIDGSETGTSFRQALRFMDIGFRLHDTMIYERINPLPLNHNRYEQAFEFVFILSRGAPRQWNPIKVKAAMAGKRRTGTMRNHGSDELQPKQTGGEYASERVPGNVWGYAVGREFENAGRHPAVFPEGLARDHILSWSNEGAVVLDPFLGSGTTAKMARLMGRQCIGIEVNSEYCEIAIERLRQGVLF
jgi:site-specific DNA-methyltransferase (adenine-specific)